MEYDLTDLSQQVLAARGGFRPVLIQGGGTKSFYGNPFEQSGNAPYTLDMRVLRGIVNYQPSELVVTARAGTRLQELIDTLDASGQMLAFDPPSFGPQATVGGCVASGLSGPGRQGAGSLRDFVLGAHLLDAQGSVMRFGGEVMKNVAGYDVSRLLAGSLGMFGAIVQVSLKVAPKPVCTCTIEFDLDEAAALELCHGLRAQPLPVSASAWEHLGGQTGRLRIRLGGALAAVSSARARLGGNLVDDVEAGRYWADLREQRLPFFGQTPLWRLAVEPGTPVLGLGPSVFEWGGTQRWIAARGIDANSIRQVARSAGGHATLFRPDPAQPLPGDGVFEPLAPVVLAIVRRLKQEFDPQGVFNPGRLVAGI